MTAEAAQRDRAERQLATGLLRPIGVFEKELLTEPVTNSAELRSFMDWSAIKDSGLKLRVLEVALENPETAMRLARRAEQAVQACVGLSPTRRAQAIKLTSARQRDLKADPRIRIAACWLALELASTDLSAWNGGCDYLSDPKNGSGHVLGEFIEFAARRSNQLPQRILNWDHLISIFENSTTVGQRHLCTAVPHIVRQLGPEQLERAFLSIIRKPLGGSNEGLSEKGVPLPRVFEFAASRMAPAQIRRIADALLTRSEGVWPEMLAAVTPRLDPKDVQPFIDAELAIAANRRGFGVGWGFGALTQRLQPQEFAPLADRFLALLATSPERTIVEFAPLAPRLAPAQINKAADTFFAILADSPEIAAQGFAALAPRLDPEQAVRAWDGLIHQQGRKDDRSAMLEFEGERSHVPAALKALAPRLGHRGERAADGLIELLQKPGDKDTAFRAVAGLRAISSQLTPTQIERAAAIATKLLPTQFESAADGLAVLAPRLQPAQAQRAWDTLTANPDEDARWSFDLNGGKARYVGEGRALKELASRLEPVHVKQALDGIIVIAARSPEFCESGLAALAPRLDPAQSNRAWNAALIAREKAIALTEYPELSVLASRLNYGQTVAAANALIAMLESSSDARARSVACTGLIELKARLESSQVHRAANACIQLITHGDSIGTQLLIALAPRLNSEQANLAWDAVVAASKNSQEFDFWDNSALALLATRLEGVARDNRATQATAVLLDRGTSIPSWDDYVAEDLGTMDPSVLLDTKTSLDGSLALAKSITQPRSLAKLLSHPNCVAALREWFLQRFEELVFFDGKSVFWKDANSDSQAQTIEKPPPRRLRNLHDAAAWIHQNWPDFDLETNCPATWRGSR